MTHSRTSSPAVWKVPIERQPKGAVGDVLWPRGAVLECHDLPLPGQSLCRIVEELLFRDALTVPTLVRQLFHVGECSIEPLELEDPTNDYVISAHEDRTNALGSD